MHHPLITAARRATLALALFACAVGRAQDQPATGGRGSDLTQLDPENFVGVLKCADCHEKPNALRRTNSNTAWINLDEFAKWSTLDKHALAFAMLKSDRAKQMGRVLWKDEDVTTRQECLSCHANWIKGAPKPKQINLEQGVSCESCHGPGKDYLVPHEEKEWRLLTNAEKRAKSMVNVRDPRERARQCLSCHIGNTDEDKVLTHDMYAAGHPPLPGIEIGTFAQNMPPHWRTLNEKVADLARLSPPKPLPELQTIRELLSQPEGQFHGVKSVLVGGLMNLRESADLVGQQAPKQGQKGLEFALFDCAMCHHELQTQSWRQTRMLAGRYTPGRPQLQHWPTALVDVALLHAAGGNAQALGQRRAELASLRSDLREIFNRSPFGIGHGAEIAAASSKLVQWLDERVTEASAAPYDRAACEALLKNLCGLIQQGGHLDYDSARQMAWALRAIWLELNPPVNGAAKLPQAFVDMTTTLRLDLPWGQKVQIIEPQNQKAAYEAVANYRFEDFQTQVKHLSDALGTAAPGR